jgi:hypothetical protein
MENDDLPKDLTFTDPAITARPVKKHVPAAPKPEVSETAMGRLRDIVIGVILVVGFFAALYAFSLLMTGLRGK